MGITTQIDTALLLCAGLGTRMGIIGQHLPKPLWPLFDRTILDYQIQYLRNLRIKKIFLNTHYLANQIKEYLNQTKYQDITILHEPELLKSGGTIHNLLKLQKETFSKLLVLNSDQFYFPHQDTWARACFESDSHTAVLFPLTCSPRDEYNELITENNILREIINFKNIKKNQNDSYITFSGMGIINMNKLTYIPGISDFWQTVANYKSDKVYITHSRDYSYYDFGTNQRYFDTCFKVADEMKSKINLFSKLGGCPPVMTDQRDDQVLNFSRFSFSKQPGHKAIILKSNQETIINTSGLYFNEIIDPLV